MTNSAESAAGGLELESIDAAGEMLGRIAPWAPEIAVLPGAGTGPTLLAGLDIVATVDAAEVAIHASASEWAPRGSWIFAEFEGARLLVVEGRRYLHEGVPARALGWPVRVVGRMGARAVILTERARRLNPSWSAGEVARVDDHINLFGDNPLAGPNLDAFGPRFPDLSEPYDPELGGWADAAAVELGVSLRSGVLAAVAGPTVETRAEERMLREFGAEMVGWGSVAEAIVARHMGLRVLTLCALVDGGGAKAAVGGGAATVGEKAAVGRAEEAAVEAVSSTRMGAAQAADATLAGLVRGVLRRMAGGGRESSK